MSQDNGSHTYVTVFGGSHASPDGPLYRQAYDLGRGLARAGFGVISGGYGGTMEAVSRGAREAEGQAIGITLATFDVWGRCGNPWLSAEHKAADYLSRLAELTGRASGFVALQGGIGTLSEVSITLSMLQIGEIAPKPLVLLGGCWQPYLDVVQQQFNLRSGDLDRVHVAADVRDAVAWLCHAVKRGP